MAKKKELEVAEVGEMAVEPEEPPPLPQADPFDDLLQAVRDTAPNKNVDPETGIIRDHRKPATDNHEARLALQSYVGAMSIALGPDHPDVERKRRLMNLAFR